MTKPKLLWHSNAPFAPTGYGQQTALFAPSLAEHYDLYLSANYGLEAAPIMWNGVPLLPGMGQTAGNETIPAHVTALFDHPRAGTIFTLYDTPPLDAQLFAHWNTVCWTPVDHDPVPPAVTNFFRESGAVPIAMSRFGERELAEFDPLYVPHAVDTDIYKPTPSDVRKEMNLPPDAFLVGMVAANKGRPSRKCFQQAFEAFRYLREKHPNAYLYVHTTVAAEFAGGEDIRAMLASLGIDDAVRFPNQYSMMFSPLPAAKMAEIYSALDVLLNPAMGEGFGIPVLEAQACGTPVVVTDFSAMPEVGKVGWQVKGRAFWSGQCAWQAVPDVGELLSALRACYQMTDAGRATTSEAAVAHAANYALPKVMAEHMLPALEEARRRFEDRKPVHLKAVA